MNALILIVSMGLAAAPTPDQLVNQVQAAYHNGGDMTAQFTQTYIDKLRGKKRVESGNLWVKTDGRVRWSYMKPQRKDFVYDGTTAYFYEPDNAQVTVFEHFGDSPIANAMQFLWGQGELRKSFEVQACDTSCAEPSKAGAKAGEVAVRMVPKEGIAAVDHVVLWMDEKAQRVRRSLVYDPLGNVTEYQFTDVQLGVRIEAAKFSFTVPQGVSLLRATAEGAAVADPNRVKPPKAP